jgi:hypothetical protein
MYAAVVTPTVAGGEPVFGTLVNAFTNRRDVKRVGRGNFQPGE